MFIEHSNFPTGVEIADVGEIRLSSAFLLCKYIRECAWFYTEVWKGLLNLGAKWFILNKDKNPCDFTNRFPVHSSV